MVIDIIIRIVVLPFYIGITLIFALRMWVGWCVNFLRFGGEAIAYYNKNQRKTIASIYCEIEKQRIEK